MDTTCLELSPFVAVAVSLLKRVGFVRNNPKLVAVILSAVLAGAHAWFRGGLPTVAQFAACVLEALAGAVTTHEIALKPTLRFLASGDVR